MIASLPDREPIPMQTRADGWPLCPICSEDEVYCLAQPACICATMACYRCGWKGDPRFTNYLWSMAEVYGA